MRIRIRVKQSDPYQSEKHDLDPYQSEKHDSDPYQSDKQDPDPYQNGLDPQHCSLPCVMSCSAVSGLAVYTASAAYLYLLCLSTRDTALFDGHVSYVLL